jgi:hypothetical protein
VCLCCSRRSSLARDWDSHFFATCRVAAALKRRKKARAAKHEALQARLRRSPAEPAHTTESAVPVAVSRPTHSGGGPGRHTRFGDTADSSLRAVASVTPSSTIRQEMALTARTGGVSTVTGPGDSEVTVAGMRPPAHPVSVLQREVTPLAFDTTVTAPKPIVAIIESDVPGAVPEGMQSRIARRSARISKHKRLAVRRRVAPALWFYVILRCACIADVLLNPVLLMDVGHEHAHRITSACCAAAAEVGAAIRSPRRGCKVGHAAQ